MYQRFYGLTTKPFHTTPDPDFLYLSPSHKQALGTIMYGIEERKGFMAVLGEVGLGKTTILRAVLAQIETTHNRIIYLLNPNLSLRDFLQTLLCELDQPQESQDEAELVSHIHHVLIEEYAKGKTVVLFIDEAQYMPIPTLEGLRLLSNLETTKNKLIQIVLVGQPELCHILERHELRQLDQRIAIRATIFPLTARESHDYIQHRLVMAGAKINTIFSKAALSAIIRYAKGNPRQINRLCDNALVTGVGYNKTPVTAKMVKEVIADMQGMKPKESWKWIPVAASLVVALLAVGWLIVEKPIGSEGVRSVIMASELMSQVVNRSKALPETNETNDYLNNNLDPLLGSQEISTRQALSHTGTRNTTTLGQEKGKNNTGDGVDLLLAEKQKNLLPKNRLPDKTVAIMSGAPQSSDATPEFPQNREMATTVVREGDTLELLTRKVYGISNPLHIKEILKANPHIQDSNHLFPGQTVRFPSIAAQKKDTTTIH